MKGNHDNNDNNKEKRKRERKVLITKIGNKFKLINTLIENNLNTVIKVQKVKKF